MSDWTDLIDGLRSDLMWDAQEWISKNEPEKAEQCVRLAGKLETLKDDENETT